MPTQEMPDFAQPLGALAQQQQVSVSSSTTIAALKDVANNGTVVDASTRSKLNFVGTNAISDDSANDRVTVKLCDRGTSFPSSPNDQDEYAYVADATNGVVWRFKYNAGSSSSYKWEFIGGPQLVSSVATGESTSSGTYAALATVGPSVALPFAGDWDVAIGAYIDPNTNLVGRMSFDIGGTGAVDANAITEVATGAAQAGTGHRWRQQRLTGLSAVTLTAKYKSSGVSTFFQDRLIAVTPVRK